MAATYHISHIYYCLSFYSQHRKLIINHQQLAQPVVVPFDDGEHHHQWFQALGQSVKGDRLASGFKGKLADKNKITKISTKKLNGLMVFPAQRMAPKLEIQHPYMAATYHISLIHCFLSFHSQHFLAPNQWRTPSTQIKRTKG